MKQALKGKVRPKLKDLKVINSIGGEDGVVNPTNRKERRMAAKLARKKGKK
tara:strand:+ start:231 stop:383 length:153 start_codon:yes stop_codon:yes gene_type:complete